MRVLTTLCAAVVLVGPLAAATQPPNLAGVWILDGFRGGGPLGFRNERSICQLPAEKAAAPSIESPDGSQLTPVGNVEGQITITQSATSLIVERTYGGSMGGGSLKNVLTLDGAESAATMGGIRSVTRSRWDGASLVVDHQLRWGAAPNEVGCNVRETFSLDDPHTLRIVATNLELQRGGTATQTYTRRR